MKTIAATLTNAGRRSSPDISGRRARDICAEVAARRRGPRARRREPLRQARAPVGQEPVQRSHNHRQEQKDQRLEAAGRQAARAEGSSQIDRNADEQQAGESRGGAELADEEIAPGVHSSPDLIDDGRAAAATLSKKARARAALARRPRAL